MTRTPPTDLPVLRAMLDAHPQIVAVIEATANQYECFGICDAGKVSGAHIVNHTDECAHMQLLLGSPVPEDYTWDGQSFNYTPGTEEEDV